MENDFEKFQLAERSISKKYRKEIWGPFIAAVQRYKLIESGDKIAVCVSGGKDSMLLAKLMQMLQRHSEVPFENVFLVMDPGYNKENRKRIEDNAKLLNIPIEIFETDIFSVADKTEKSPCYLCARMRRGHLYSKAKEYGCNKIALGHHLNDVIETVVMSMFYSSQLQSMPPKLISTNFEGMELIRPLYYIREEDIIAWRDYNKLQFLRCACRFTEALEAESGDRESASKRKETKLLIQQLKKTNPSVEANIFNSMHNVALDAVIAYKTKGKKHHFLDTYQGESHVTE